MGDIIQESRAALSRYTRAASSESAINDAQICQACQIEPILPSNFWSSDILDKQPEEQVEGKWRSLIAGSAGRRSS
jgi:hypothetical protein